MQRVSHADVAVAGERIARIEGGLLLLVGFGTTDNHSLLAHMARKVAHLRVFPGEHGRLHHSVLETRGGTLAVPQFTLYGDVSRGRRPEFGAALAPGQAQPLFDGFVTALRDCGIAQVESGRFGAHMAVSSCNDGPVTLLLEREIRG